MMPPWKPPPGPRCPWVTTQMPSTTTGPTSAAPAARSAGAVRGPRRSSFSAAWLLTSSPRPWRNSTALPSAATNRMSSSPSVSKPRRSYVIALTTFAECRWWTAVFTHASAGPDGVPNGSRSPTAQPARASLPDRARGRGRQPRTAEEQEAGDEQRVEAHLREQRLLQADRDRDQDPRQRGRPEVVHAVERVAQQDHAEHAHDLQGAAG